MAGWDSVTPWTAARQASLSFTVSQSLIKPVSIESVMPSNHLMLCHPRLLLPSIFPSIRDFSSELALCIRWPKYWSFSFSISPSNEHSGLISFRMDWFHLLAVQGTLKSLLWSTWLYLAFLILLNTQLHMIGKQEHVLCYALLSGSVVSDSLQPHGREPARFLCPWGWFRQEYWSGLPCPPPGDLPNSGIKPRSPTLLADSFLPEPPGKPKNTGVRSLSLLQGISPAQKSNWDLLHYKRILYQLSYQGSQIAAWV